MNEEFRIVLYIANIETKPRILYLRRSFSLFHVFADCPRFCFIFYLFFCETRRDNARPLWIISEH